MVNDSPQATCLHGGIPVISWGTLVVRSESVLTPSCPYEFPPNENTVPSISTQTIWDCPQLTPTIWPYFTIDIL